MRVAVIGAGPSGLVTLRYLKDAHNFFPGRKPIEAKLFEAEDVIGGTFAKRTYEDAELVSSRFLTSFSDFRPSDRMPDFLSADEYLQYLSDYADHFHLRPDINLSTPILSVRRRRGGGHIVTYSQNGDEQVWECDAIAVCTGLHVVPNLPTLPGAERVPVVKHSSEFKLRSEFGKNKTVVVMGSGETGIDIAHLAVTSPTARVVLCHRDGFLGAPKKIPNPRWLPCIFGKADPNKVDELPVDVSWQAPLFDSMWLHPWIKDTLFTWNVYDKGIKASNWLVSGTYHGVDQWVGGVSAARYHASKLFFNKGAPKALPYISAPYRPANPHIIERIRRNLVQMPIEEIPAGRTIELAPMPTHVDASGRIHFADNGRPEYARMQSLSPTKPDVIIYATGYRQEFPFFANSSAYSSNLSPADRRPYPVASDADVRSIFAKDDPTVGFIGFVRPGYGAIPPLAELQTQLWLLNLMDPSTSDRLKESDEHHFRLRGKGRIGYGVDHETYAYQLALDIGSAPSFMQMMRAGWSVGGSAWLKLPIMLAAAAQLTDKFRVVGPYAWDGAPRVLAGELWQTISRRKGLFGHFTLSIAPIVTLGTFSLLLWILSPVLFLLKLILTPFIWACSSGRKTVGQTQRNDYVQLKA